MKTNCFKCKKFKECQPINYKNRAFNVCKKCKKMTKSTHLILLDDLFKGLIR